MRILEILEPSYSNAGTWLIPKESRKDAGARGARSFEVFSELTSLKSSYDQGRARVIRGNSIQINLLCEPLEPVVWGALPIPSHRVDTDSPLLFDVLTEVLLEIERLFPSSVEAIEQLAYNLVIVRLGPEPEGDTLITSASFPSLPFTIFLSEKGFFHIPPNTVSKEPSVYAFVENFLHEVIHQAVNLTMFDQSVFKEDFDAKTAPKIEIPWRTSSGARNRAWELDRTWHAYCVYQGLKEVRETLLAQDRLLTTLERKNVEQALRQGSHCMDYLESQLIAQKNFLSDSGRETLESLVCQKGASA